MERTDPAEVPEPSEARGMASARLKREGRLAEATLYRDRRRDWWRNNGHRPRASELAWAEMIADFPPLPEPEPEPEIEAKPKAATPATATDPLDITSADAELLDRLAAIPVDWDRDVLWCYRYMPHPQVQLDQAPSLSAWGLLRIAREDPAKFLVQVAASAARTTKTSTTDRETPAPQPRETQDPGLEDLRRMIDDAS